MQRPGIASGTRGKDSHSRASPRNAGLCGVPSRAAAEEKAAIAPLACRFLCGEPFAGGAVFAAASPRAAAAGRFHASPVSSAEAVAEENRAEVEAAREMLDRAEVDLAQKDAVITAYAEFTGISMEQLP